MTQQGQPVNNVPAGPAVVREDKRGGRNKF